MLVVDRLLGQHVQAHPAEPVGAPALTYVNRLSDALFVMARYENLVRGEPDVLWDSRA